MATSSSPRCPIKASGAKIMEQIAAQMVAKKLPLVTDLRDESTTKPDPSGDHAALQPGWTWRLMAHLFATTGLGEELLGHLNILGLDNPAPGEDPKTILTEWLSFRRETVRRRLQYRLDKVLARLHIPSKVC